VGLIQQFTNIVLSAGEKIVDSKDIVALLDKSFPQQKTQKTGATCDKNAFST